MSRDPDLEMYLLWSAAIDRALPVDKYYDAVVARMMGAQRERTRRPRKTGKRK